MRREQRAFARWVRLSRRWRSLKRAGWAQTRRASARWPAVESVQFYLGGEKPAGGSIYARIATHGNSPQFRRFQRVLARRMLWSAPVDRDRAAGRMPRPHAPQTWVERGHSVLNSGSANVGTEKLMTTPHLSPRSFWGVAQSGPQEHLGRLVESGH